MSALLAVVIVGGVFGLLVLLMWRAIRKDSIRSARHHYRTMKELREEERRRIQANTYCYSSKEQEQRLRDHDLDATAQLARIRDFACDDFGCDPDEITGAGRGGYP